MSAQRGRIPVLKILIVHNKYQLAGGEDAVVRQETAMLRDAGEEVYLFEVDNHGIHGISAKIRTAAQLSYSWQMRSRLSRLIAELSPDIVHIHNFFPKISPSVYDACADHNCPTIQTLHNYRLLCSNAQLYRDGKVCHDCLKPNLISPAILHGCYRGSKVGSASVAAMIAFHKLRGTWNKRVHKYIVLTEFARDIITENLKIAPQKLIVKPNAATDRGVGAGGGGYLLYVGRLSAEKGISTLLEATRLGLPLPLKVAGTGPLLPEVQAAHAAGHLTLLGEQPADKIHALMKEAEALIIPSLWYEGLPMVVPEAFSTGLPIIASRIGSLSTLIVNDVNGIHFEAGNIGEIKTSIERFISNPQLKASLRTGARRSYERYYRPESNLALLQSIYRAAIAEVNPLRYIESASKTVATNLRDA